MTFDMSTICHIMATFGIIIYICYDEHVYHVLTMLCANDCLISSMLPLSLSNMQNIVRKIYKMCHQNFLTFAANTIAYNPVVVNGY